MPTKHTSPSWSWRAAATVIISSALQGPSSGPAVAGPLTGHHPRRDPVGSPALPVLEPRVAPGVLPGVIGVEVDEDPLDEEVADLEHVAPAAGAPLGHPGPPGTVAVLAMAGALAHQDVATGEDPVEARVVVDDPLEGPANVAEQPDDLVLARGQPPLGEVDLRVVGEEVEDAPPGRR